MKKIICLVILIIAFLIVFISCINKNNPSNSEIDKGNDISDNKHNEEDALDINSDKKNAIDNFNNDKEDLDNKSDNNSNNITEEFENYRLFGNIPYDKSIKYTSSINGNLSNRANIADDENYIYYINVNDENKLYRVNKDGKDNKLIYEESIRELQCYNGKLYFLKSVEVEKDPSGFPIYDNYICSIDSDGNNYKEITYDREMKKFLILNGKIYYIAFSGLGEGLDLLAGQYDLFCYDIESKKKSTIYKFIQIGEDWILDSTLNANGDNIYFLTWFDGIIEYNIKTNNSRVILDEDSDYYTIITNFIVLNDKLIFKCKDDRTCNNEWKIYLKDIKYDEDKTLCIFSQIKVKEMLMSVNINDSYVFLTYMQFNNIPEEAKIILVRMKYDGSEVVKIKEIPCMQPDIRPVGQIYIIDDKLIFLNSLGGGTLENMIKIMDFDGNTLDWDI